MPVLEPNAESINLAAEALRRGECIVMPTETVYGLACNALDAEAVRRVFALKGRPDENPLIVHLAEFAELGRVAQDWPPQAEALAARFWPGPLTLVLAARPEVPRATTAGLDTVAVRVPAHPVARAVIAAAGVPLASPSANLFTALSPTRAEALDPRIRDGAALVLDGGPCEVGVESTVLDLTAEVPVILRPGGVTRGELEQSLGQRIGHAREERLRRSPGMHRRHYAPRARLRLVERLAADRAGLTFGDAQTGWQIRMPHDARAYAANLYEALRRLDALGATEVDVETVPEDDDAWDAVRDRLRRAADPGS